MARKSRFTPISALPEEEILQIAGDAHHILNNKAFLKVFTILEDRAVQLGADMESKDVEGHHHQFLYLKVLKEIYRFFEVFVEDAEFLMSQKKLHKKD